MFICKNLMDQFMYFYLKIWNRIRFLLNIFYISIYVYVEIYIYVYDYVSIMIYLLYKYMLFYNCMLFKMFEGNEVYL